MKKNMRKLTSWLLTLVMCVSLLPSSVMAVDPPAKQTEPVESGIALALTPDDASYVTPGGSVTVTVSLENTTDKIFSFSALNLTLSGDRIDGFTKDGGFYWAKVELVEVGNDYRLMLSDEAIGDGSGFRAIPMNGSVVLGTFTIPVADDTTNLESVGVTASNGIIHQLNDATDYSMDTSNAAATKNVGYIVTFDANGGSSVDAQTVGLNGNAVEPTVTKGTDQFDGWFLSDTATEPYDFTTAVTGGITLTARWTPTYPITLPSVDQAVVILNYDGGVVNEGDTVRVPAGTEFAVDVTPDDGYAVNLTYTHDNVQYTVGETFTMPAYDVSISADSSIANYTITYVLNDGVLPDAYNQTYAAADRGTANFLPVPTRAGSTFDGWLPSGNATWGTDAITDGTVPANAANDVTLTAQWTQEEYNATLPATQPDNATVTLKDQDGNTITPETVLHYGDPVTVDVQTDEGYEVDTVTVNGDPIEKGQDDKYTFPMSDGNANVAVTTKPTEYPITFDLNDGTNEEGTKESFNVTERGGELPTPTKPGYDFDGWQPSGNDTWGSDPTTTVPENASGPVTLTAVWSLATYTVTYDANGGDAIEAQSYSINSTETVKTAARDGYEFLGWTVVASANETDWVLGTTVTAGTSLTGKSGSVTLTAQWRFLTANVTAVVKSYAYARSGEALLVVGAQPAAGKATAYDGKAMFKTDDANYVQLIKDQNPAYTGTYVYVDLIPVTAGAGLEAAAADALAKLGYITGDNQEYARTGNVAGTPEINANDWGVVQDMLNNPGMTFSNTDLTVSQRLSADVSTGMYNETMFGAIDDVNAILNASYDSMPG